MGEEDMEKGNRPWMIGDKANSVKRLRTWWGTWNPFTLNNFFNVNPMMGLSVQPSDDVLQRSLKPKMLQGEIEACRAERVLLCSPLASKDIGDEGDEGLLVITNFKLSFVTNDEAQNPNFICQENMFLGRNDVTLSNIDHIYQIVDKKKKLLTTGFKISARIDYLVVVCKNFRMFRFGFSRSAKGAGKYIAEALLKLPFPNDRTLLFGYTFKEKYYNTLRNMSMYDNKGDWVQELIRCGGANNFCYKDWRVLTVTAETRLPEGSLPLHYVVPKSLADSDYLMAAEKFRDSRNVLWVYGYGNASLIRMAELLPDITDTRTENMMIECIRACHPQKQQPILVELSKCLPSIQDVGEGYRKLRQLCTPDTAKLFRQQDDKLLKSLEASSWLLYASVCIQQADSAAREMRLKGSTVILQENDGRDLSCIVSSLVQIILDPYCRTINGFQSLIQKEWVALGHPFCDRLGHVYNNTVTEQSPLLLLFLDCVWQLLQQFCEEFEFTETYLTTLWDTAFNPVFDTFLFNCDHDRLNARLKDGLVMRPVWDWGEQFVDKDILFFTNPLYRRVQSEATTATATGHQNRKSMAVLPPSAVQLPVISLAELRRHPHLAGSAAVGGGQRPMSISVLPKVVTAAPVQTWLEPKHRIQNMELWRQCYFRWMPIVEIQGGGFVQIEMFHRLLLSNVNKLQSALQTQEFDDVPPRILSPILQQQSSQNGGGSVVGANTEDEGEAVGGITPGQIMPSVNSFFPFSQNSHGDQTQLTDILNLSNEFLVDGSIFDAISQTQLDREEQLAQQPWAMPQVTAMDGRRGGGRELQQHSEHLL